MRIREVPTPTERLTITTRGGASGSEVVIAWDRVEAAVVVKAR
jgi:hypothetical protein